MNIEVEKITMFANLLHESSPKVIQGPMFGILFE